MIATHGSFTVCRCFKYPKQQKGKKLNLESVVKKMADWRGNAKSAQVKR